MASKEGIADGIGLTFDEIILKVNPDAESDGESVEALSPSCYRSSGPKYCRLVGGTFQAIKSERLNQWTVRQNLPSRYRILFGVIGFYVGRPLPGRGRVHANRPSVTGHVLHPVSP